MIKAAHHRAAEQRARQPNHRPRVTHSDVFPKLHDFFQLTLGAQLVGQLGLLFHFMDWILRRAHPGHPSHWAAVQAFERCIHRHFEEEEDKVIAALKDGTMNHATHSDDEIQELQDSPKWSNRCGCPVSKRICPQDAVKANMATWWIKCKVEASEGGEPPGEGALRNGASMFMSGT